MPTAASASLSATASKYEGLIIPIAPVALTGVFQFAAKITGAGLSASSCSAYNGLDGSGCNIGIGREHRERSRDPAGFRVFQGMG